MTNGFLEKVDEVARYLWFQLKHLENEFNEIEKTTNQTVNTIGIITNSPYKKSLCIFPIDAFKGDS